LRIDLSVKFKTITWSIIVFRVAIKIVGAILTRMATKPFDSQRFPCLFLLLGLRVKYLPQESKKVKKLAWAKPQIKPGLRLNK
jgi:hypothetical protein